MGFLKTKTSYKAADILDWVFTAVFTAPVFWAGWRAGLAFIAYDLSRACEKVKEGFRASEALERLLKNSTDKT
ncbi:MAG: hypothetical protein LBL20_05990 [Treponema sp.]|jgi:hypothetical protein|nr:hypothetical protein [Treponema sp.]